jgi:hypothetical protein
MNPRIRILCLLGVVMLALAGCGGDRSPHPAASPTPSAVDDRTALLQVAACFRSHGYPNFPDPVQDKDGQWIFPDSAGNPQASACDALKRQNKQRQRQERPSAADMAKLRQVARCMREHGVPDWPDPYEDGSFLLPPRLQPQDMHPENNATMRAAYDACSKYAPSGGIRTG